MNATDRKQLRLTNNVAFISERQICI